ncbi:GIN domain-containing protein [Sphingobium sp.]|uniref:GIN domain-containing protein n=1 Tax=Sphingobium sp. TaxID=1912891 RepID=UPI003B3A136C
MHDQRNGTGRSALRTLIATGGAALLLGAAPAGAATRGYTITSFDAIRVDAPVTVILTTGTGASARADGDIALLDRLKLDVSGRVMTISMDAPRNGEKSRGAATLRLSTGTIERVILSGGGSIAIDRIKGLQGQMVLGGNGDISVANIDLDQMDLMLAGGGRMTLAGRTGIANIRVTGAGTLAAEPLRARQATVSNEGPGSISLTADVTADIRASGSGTVTLTGKAVCTVDNRGTGQISCGGETY